MPRKKLPFPLFLKFLLACVVLAGLLIFGGTLVVKEKSRFADRGAFLVGQLHRYEAFQDQLGSAQTGTTEILASEINLLRESLGKDAGLPIMEEDAILEPTARSLYERVSGKNGIDPDLFLIFGKTGKLLWAPPNSPVTAAQMSQIAAVEKAREGGVFAHRTQVIDNVAYLVTALPVYAPIPRTDTQVGGILVGIKVSRLTERYAKQTSDDPARRYLPVLINRMTVLASALPGDAQEVAKAMQPDQVVRLTVGGDTRDVIRLKAGDFDFYCEPEDGYTNADPGTVGKLCIAHSRAMLVDPASSMPWVEIGVGIALSLLIAFGLALWVTRPIERMVKQSGDLLAGDTDLTQRIVVNSRDETSRLADNINQVFARVHSLATGVQSAAFQVGVSSAEISAASRQMLGGLKDQTVKIESSTTAVTELSASIQRVAGNVAEATEVAEQSTTAVNSTIQRMDQIRHAVDDAGRKMHDLAESSKRIGNIVDVIRQISEQTSMLALNASIEAAHAGEQGRGFAVVADEVSSLARRVGQSAKDIEALIQTVKEQTQAAITSMEVGTREVGNGSALVTSTLNGLAQLITAVKDTGSTLQEQAMVSDEIARNMDAVRHIATEVLSGSEESVVQAERLHGLAFELEESIAGFNLDGAKLGSSRAEPPRAEPPSPSLPAGRPTTSDKSPPTDS